MPLLPFSSSFLFASQAPDLKRSGAPMLIVLYHEDRANTCTIQSAKAKPCSSAGPSRGGILVAGAGAERRARTALRTAPFERPGTGRIHPGHRRSSRDDSKSSCTRGAVHLAVRS